jgi:hypothetical protein
VTPGAQVIWARITHARARAVAQLARAQHARASAAQRARTCACSAARACFWASPRLLSPRAEATGVVIEMWHSCAQNTGGVRKWVFECL